MGNQYPEMRLALRPEIYRVKAHIESGKSPSEIANSLHAQGLGAIQLLLIFREATGASLAELKAFGQWWGPDGVTDVEAFDRWAAQIFPQQRPVA